MSKLFIPKSGSATGAEILIALPAGGEGSCQFSIQRAGTADHILGPQGWQSSDFWFESTVLELKDNFANVYLPHEVVRHLSFANYNVLSRWIGQSSTARTILRGGELVPHASERQTSVISTPKIPDENVGKLPPIPSLLPVTESVASVANDPEHQASSGSDKAVHTASSPGDFGIARKVQPEPSKVQPEPSKVQPEPSKVQPEPSKVQPEPSRALGPSETSSTGRKIVAPLAAVTALIAGVGIWFGFLADSNSRDSAKSIAPQTSENKGESSPTASSNPTSDSDRTNTNPRLAAPSQTTGSDSAAAVVQKQKKQSNKTQSSPPPTSSEASADGKPTAPDLNKLVKDAMKK